MEQERQTSGHEGVNSRQVSWLLSENQLADALNMEIDKIGRISTRKGAAALGGRTDTPGGGIEEYVDGNGNAFFSAFWEDNLYKSAGAGDWTRIACGESIASGILHMGAAGRLNGQRAVAYTGVTDDVGARGPLLIYDVDNDASTLVTECGTPRCVAWFQNRYWAAEGETLYWSEILDTAGFSLAGMTLGIEPGNGGDVTALIPSRDLTPRMWILKERAVLVLEPRWGSSSAIIPTAGDSLDVINTNLRTLTLGAGCVATKSARWIPGAEGSDVMFLAQDGFRSLQRAANDVQSGAGFPLSYTIPDWIARINFDHADKAVAAVYDNKYHCAVPMDGATENTHILVYNIATKGWSLLDWQAVDLNAFRLKSTDALYFQNAYLTTDTSVTDAAGDPVYQVYKAYNGLTDPGPTHVKWFYQTRTMVFQQPTRQKRWDEFRFLVGAEETASFEFQTRIDFGPYNTTDTVMVAAGENSVVLGQDGLVWQSGPEVTRRKSFSLSDIPPGENIQFKVESTTGASEFGQLHFYMQSCRAHLLQDVFEQEQ
jgi:hypothetical protein